MFWNSLVYKPVRNISANKTSIIRSDKEKIFKKIMYKSNNVYQEKSSTSDYKKHKEMTKTAMNLMKVIIHPLE